jgi:hypothetical protein
MNEQIVDTRITPSDLLRLRAAAAAASTSPLPATFALVSVKSSKKLND